MPQSGDYKEAAAVDWSSALAFLDYFENPDFDPGYLDGLLPVTPWVDAPETDAFIDSLYDIGAIKPFDWHAWQDEAQRFRTDSDALSSASLEELQKLLTLHARMDRFSDGHVAAMLFEGHIQSILRRIQELVD